MAIDKKLFAQLKNAMEDVIYSVVDELPSDLKNKYCFTFVARDFDGDHDNDVVLTNDVAQDACDTIARNEAKMVEAK